MDLTKKANWEVGFTSKAARRKKQLPETVAEELARLIKNMELAGPIQKDWSHFGPLKKDRNIPSNSYHCHLKSGRPTYVACWQVIDKKIQIIEIFYVGTHENAPY